MKNVTEREAYNQYDEMLDGVSEVKIGNLTYNPSRVLKELDPIAYNCGFSDFLDLEDLEIVD